jgi:hypothetical protein
MGVAFGMAAGCSSDRAALSEQANGSVALSSDPERYYSDAGKVCTDSSQCLGRCLASKDAKVGQSKVTGLCQGYKHRIGCAGELAEGKVIHVICID